MLTQKRLKELLTYNPKTGKFYKNEPAGFYHESSGRFIIKVDGKKYPAARLAFLYMTGDWPNKFADHVNCDLSDDRWENLREASTSQNGANAMIRRNNKVGLKGVSIHSPGKYRAQIKVGGKVKYLGLYASPEEAYTAYLNAATECHGEFARG